MTTTTQARPGVAQRIAQALQVGAHQVEAAITLLDEGATVPFIARYRKEVTGGLSDTHLRDLEEKMHYLRELDDRREAILSSIGEQGKLTPALERQIHEAETKTQLEDLYLPYRKKRRTKGQIAREAGLEPLALRIWKNPNCNPEVEAGKFIDPARCVADVDAALEGARYILMELFAEDGELMGRLRDYMRQRGFITSKAAKGKEADGAKFQDYFDYAEPVAKAPSHRILALLRGFKEDILKLDIAPDRAQLEGEDYNRCEATIARHFRIDDRGRPGDEWLLRTVQLTWKAKIHPHLKLELLSELKTAAELEAIKVFSTNLKDLLMAAPAGPRAVIGLDPGLRTGVKLAAVDATGKLLECDTLYPHAPQRKWEPSLKRLAQLCKRHKISLIAIGNGTASRETDRLAAELISRNPDLGVQKVMVSEAGASVYSASELAAEEFPDLDVSLRGAVSIARRLQDPLAELVKIDPKAIGVGQYQHDVNQTRLARGLDAVVEDCVNGVGVDVNTASAALLSHVSGLSKTLAGNVVAWRDENGRFSTRAQLMKVPRMGARSFEQSAGFLRIMNGKQPLDGSAVHPEAYPLVDRIAKAHAMNVASLIGNTAFLKSVKPSEFTDERFGVPTIADILTELEKPGRDPRPEFKTAVFREGVENISDLSPGMVLEGVVSNVTNFGAFVDVGVHQDGLVHISQLADYFVKDPRDVVKAGDVVEVRVVEVDVRRKRISLSMKDL